MKNQIYALNEDLLNGDYFVITSNLMNRYKSSQYRFICSFNVLGLAMLEMKRLQAVRDGFFL